MSVWDKPRWGGSAGSDETAPQGESGGGDGLNTQIRDGQVWQRVDKLDVVGQPTGEYEWVRVASAPKGEGEGSGAEPRNDALTAAQAALAGFLQAQTLADARKLAAMENFQKIGQWAVPDGAEHAPNFEPGGLANTAYAVSGMKKFTPPPLQTRRVNPSDTAGDIPPEIRQMIGAVTAAGGR